MEFGVDLAQEVRRELRFLATISEHEELLQEGRVLKLAIYRYEWFWLPLMADLEVDYACAELCPPLDVHWIWHCHMLCPHAYARDMKNIMAKTLNHKFPSCTEEETQRKQRTRELWEKKFKHQSFELDPRLDTPSYETRISHNLVEGVLRQRDFFYNVSLPHFGDARFLENAVDRYRRFLEMKKQHRKRFLTPMYDIDVIWHTHQLHPVTYARDMTSLLGYVLNHDDTDQSRKPGSKLNKGHTDTAQLYREMYGEVYWASGCSYRGLPPNKAMPPRRVKVWEGVLEHLEVDGLDLPVGLRFRLQVSLLNHHKGETLVAVKKGPRTHWPQGKEWFVWDETKHRGLRFTIVFQTGRGCVGTEEPVAQCDIPLEGCVVMEGDIPVNSDGSDTTTERCEPFTALSSHQLKATLRVRIKAKPHSKTVRRKNLALDMKPRENETVRVLSRETWGPVPVPARAATLAGRVSNHSLFDKSGAELFKLKFVHSLDIIMSACLISDQTDQLQAAVHLIGTNQLPLPHHVSAEFPSVMTVDPAFGERAMLVKDRQGDYALLTGRWRLQDGGDGLGNSATASFPGFLQFNYINLRHTRHRSIYLPSMSRAKLSKISFLYRLDHVSVDMTSGRITVDRACSDVAASVGVCLAVSLLFVLCSPWAGRPEILRNREQTRTPSGGQNRASRITLSDLQILEPLGFYDTQVPTMHYLQSRGHRGIGYTDVDGGSVGEDGVGWEDSGFGEVGEDRVEFGGVRW